MEFKTCQNCCMVFQYSGIGEELCTECKKTEEEYLRQVREILSENPVLCGEEIVRLTGISEKLLEKFAKSQKIILQEFAEQATTCAMCGISITSGKYCAACNRRLKAEAERSQSPYWHPDTSSAKQAMRFIRRKNK